MLVVKVVDLLLLCLVVFGLICVGLVAAVCWLVCLFVVLFVVDFAWFASVGLGFGCICLLTSVVVAVV